MTRINCVPVQELTNQHLVAEYREIMRLPGNLKKSLNRKTKFKLREIPSEYTLGQGHVKFFYDKFNWLKRRFSELVGEMLKREMSPNFKDTNIFDDKDIPNWAYQDWTPDSQAIEINRQRILERLSK